MWEQQAVAASACPAEPFVGGPRPHRFRRLWSTAWMSQVFSVDQPFLSVSMCPWPLLRVIAWFRGGALGVALRHRKFQEMRQHRLRDRSQLWAASSPLRRRSPSQKPRPPRDDDGHVSDSGHRRKFASDCLLARNRLVVRILRWARRIDSLVPHRCCEFPTGTSLRQIRPVPPRRSRSASILRSRWPRAPRQPTRPSDAPVGA
mmetsp:Transcript_70817/g.188948  ORF Transcript_70817/g.188948 Transcript_70817/m.188948 type:complete len:203 (+) Transcript_70817:1513-2121(+)